MLRSNISAAAILVLTTLAPACGPDFGADDLGEGTDSFADETGGDSAGDEDGDEDDDSAGTDTDDIPASSVCEREEDDGCDPGDTDTDTDGDDTDTDGDDEDGDGDGDGDGVCEPHQTKLIAAQHIDAGVVSVRNDGESLGIEVEANAPYLLAEVHAYAGADPIPADQKGVAPGQFPYTEELVELSDGWSIEIPLAELGLDCQGEDHVEIAVHAVVVSIEDGALVFEETAWAFGTDPFENGWGWSGKYALCCEA